MRIYPQLRAGKPATACRNRATLPTPWQGHSHAASMSSSTEHRLKRVVVLGMNHGGHECPLSASSLASYPRRWQLAARLPSSTHTFELIHATFLTQT